MPLATALLLTGSSSTPAPAFNPQVSVEASAVIDAGAGATDWVARASMVRRADGVLVLAYYKATNHFNNQGALHIRFWDDDEGDWTAEDTTLGGDPVVGFPMNPPVSAGQDAGEPQLYLTPGGSLLIHMWRVNYGSSLGGTYQSEGGALGESWTSPHGPIQFAGLTEEQNDRTFATDDHFTYAGVLYAAARVYVDADGSPSAGVLVTTDDEGETWTRVSTIVSSAHESDGAQETAIEYLGNGTIRAVMRDNPHTHAYDAISDDMGATWSELRDITSMVGIIGRPRMYTRSHLLGLPNWWLDPVLIMVGFTHEDSGESHPRRVAIWVSPDRGDTWSDPQYLADETEDGGYGDIAYIPDSGLFKVLTYRGTLDTASLQEFDLAIAYTD